MGKWHRSLLAALLLAAPLAQASTSTLLFNITMDYDEKADVYVVQDVLQSLNRMFTASVGRPVKFVMAQDAEQIGERTRTATYDVMLAPSHLIGSALKHGYTPVAKSQEQNRVVLVASRASGVKTLEQARGKRLVLPHPESLVTFVVNGEFNAMGHKVKQYFGKVDNLRMYEAVLYALELGQADVAAVKEETAQAWLAKKPDAGVIVKTLHDVPAAGVAIKAKLDDKLSEKIRLAFLSSQQDLGQHFNRLGLQPFQTARENDFEYVSTLGYFTPRVLPGGTITNADEVRAMLARGVPLFDVRPEPQYREAHIPGAVNLPYRMNSPKETDFDAAMDNWDSGKLPKDKAAAIIFQCNGPECWYSYKASRVAIALGYTKVHWFRGGMPEWKSKGNQVARATK